MANTKLKFSGQSGITARFVITDRTNDNVWDGTDLVTYVDANFSDYKQTISELGHGNYSADVPADLPAGRYHVAYYDDTADTDSIFQSLIEWDGSEVTEELETGNVSVTDICNMALSHLGVGKTVSNVETEDSENARAFNTFYATARDAVLRDFYWPFAMYTVDLGLVETDPTDEWGYSYRYPSNALKLKRILSGVRNETQDSKVPYRISRDSIGSLIYVDMQDAQLEYVFRETDPGRYHSDFVMALSYLMAYLMAPRLTRGDPQKLGSSALLNYRTWIASAQANSSNEEVPEQDPEAEMIRSRY